MWRLIPRFIHSLMLWNNDVKQENPRSDRHRIFSPTDADFIGSHMNSRDDHRISSYDKIQ